MAEIGVWIALIVVFVIAVFIQFFGGESAASIIEEDTGIVSQLRDDGATVEKALGRPPVNLGSSTSLMINGELVHLFSYGSSADMSRMMNRVSEDGRVIGSTAYSWRTPHWHGGKKTIALYLGEDQGVRNLLASNVGPEFAGSE